MEPERSATLPVVCCLPGFVAAYLLAAWHLHSTVDGFFAGGSSNISRCECEWEGGRVCVGVGVGVATAATLCCDNIFRCWLKLKAA